MIIPLFPLSIVIYPEERLNIHVFESRYKQLINYCVAEGSNFGISTYLNGKLAIVGTEVELIKIDRIYANGEMDVITEGKSIYQLIQVLDAKENQLYPCAEVAPLQNDKTSHLETAKEIIRLMHELHQFLGIEKNKIPELKNFSSYMAAHFVGLSIEQEYEFLTIMLESKRLEYLLQHLRFILPILSETEKLKWNIQANGHFKKLNPPEI